MSIETIRTRTGDTLDKYDHEIQLIDSTISTDDKPKPSSSGDWRRAARNPTRKSLKNQLSQRKYDKWRQDKFNLDADSGVESGADDLENGEPSAVVVEAHPQNEESSTVDFAGPTNGAVREVEANKGVSKKKEKKLDQEIDVLYENQRGSFFCGLPLYSHSSLLPFDPSAWVTDEFKDSPVNITNAQVPDPSWMWAWKSWYVDMSHDVDEEGWQYSFSFGKTFAWHGTHPWFYSFARRRRWLRKRVKRTDRDGSQVKESSLEAAHHLNTDYFTIHSKQRDRSPASTLNPETALARPVSFQSIREELVAPEETKDIPSLKRAIRLAKIDREKIDAIKSFVTDGGDELFYLADHMPEIMDALVFQNSRRQILEFLKRSADGAQQHRDKHDAEDRPERKDEKRRIDNLLRAADAADQQIHGLEYWSDRKHVLQTEDEGEHENAGGPYRPSDVIGEIKGISEKSQTTQEIKVDRRLVDRGKKPERSKADDDDGKEVEVTPRLGFDSVLISDADAKINGEKSA